MPKAKTLKTTLTKLQAAALRSIPRLTRANGYPPSDAEVSADMGLNGRSARPHINALIRKGLVARTPGVLRSLKVIRPKRSKPD